jgi:hypothetical protein
MPTVSTTDRIRSAGSESAPGSKGLQPVASVLTCMATLRASAARE